MTPPTGPRHIELISKRCRVLKKIWVRDNKQNMRDNEQNMRETNRI